MAAVAGPSRARADDGVSQQTAGILTATTGGVMLAFGITALAFVPHVLSQDAPAHCAEYEGGQCVVAYEPVPEDQRGVMAAALLVPGIIAIAVSAVLLWTGIADATSGDDPEDVSLSLRSDGFALRF